MLAAGHMQACLLPAARSAIFLRSDTLNELGFRYRMRRRRHHTITPPKTIRPGMRKMVMKMIEL